MKKIILPLAVVLSLVATQVVIGEKSFAEVNMSVSGDKPASYSKGDVLTYVNKNLNITKDEMGNGGQVNVKFTVTKNGDVEGIKFVKSYSKIVDAKIATILKEMGKWSPAIKDGVAVDSYHTLPIKLQQK